MNDNLQKWGLIAGIGLSAFATFLSARAIDQSKMQFAAQNLWEMRREALDDFVKASADYQTALNRSVRGNPKDLEEPGVVAALTPIELEQVREWVDPMTEARGKFQATIQVSALAWPTNWRQRMILFGARGDNLGMCPGAATLRAQNENERNGIKADLKNNCAGMGDRLDAFKKEYEGLYLDLANELYRMAGDMGASTEQ